MTFCSLSEAWGQGPDGLDSAKYQSVNYTDSNVYNHFGKPVFDEEKKKTVNRVQNMSRTQERLPQHNGPPNRYSENVKSLTLNYDNNNNISIDETEIPFSKKNNELPISAYSKQYLSKVNNRKMSHFPRHTIIENPQHSIRGKPKPIKKVKQQEEDLNDIIDNINNKNLSESTNTDISIESSIEYNPSNLSCSSDSNVGYKSPDSNIEYKSSNLINKLKQLEKKYKHILNLNQKLTKLLKKSTTKKSKGIFSHWDLLIVIALGILMIIILEYVYKIAVSKSV